MKVELYIFFEKTKKKRAFDQNNYLDFFCILQKLQRDFLVHLRKIIHVYMLKTVQAGTK